MMMIDDDDDDKVRMYYRPGTHGVQLLHIRAADASFSLIGGSTALEVDV